MDEAAIRFISKVLEGISDQLISGESDAEMDLRQSIVAGNSEHVIMAAAIKAGIVGAAQEIAFAIHVGFPDTTQEETDLSPTVAENEDQQGGKGQT